MSQKELPEWACKKCDWKFNAKPEKRNFLAFQTKKCPKCNSVLSHPYGIPTRIFMWISFVVTAYFAVPGYYVTTSAYNDYAERTGDAPLNWTFADHIAKGGWLWVVLAVLFGIGLYKNYELRKSLS